MMRTPRQLVEEIERIRMSVVNDPSISVGDERWRNALHECAELFALIPNVHEAYYDDPPNPNLLRLKGSQRNKRHD